MSRSKLTLDEDDKRSRYAGEMVNLTVSIPDDMRARLQAAYLNKGLHQTATNPRRFRSLSFAIAQVLADTLDQWEGLPDQELKLSGDRIYPFETFRKYGKKTP